MKKIRCAIYTRKSSEEGLDQDFNSLDSQREACEAYIASQKHEGWALVPKHYDDGGLSGGNLERPALKELMTDIDEGRIDQIVVYKIDRLTRSLSDFAKLVDRLDQQDASFVSVTQSFNTATSMGRLTLNVLLSFAQFEREVTAERIRDKIAASKKKGMWMGGTVPLGYEPNGRTLKINQSEAMTIRKLFELYATYQTLSAVVIKTTELGMRSKPKCTVNGHQGKELTRSQIHHILTNPLYAGYIRHGPKVYDGLHPAIITPDEFDKVQSVLKAQASKGRGYTNKLCAPSLLIGKLVDEYGERLTPSHTNKKEQRYRYYVSRRLASKCTSKNDDLKNSWRLPADRFEKQICRAITRHLLASYKSDLLTNPTAEELSKIKDLLHHVTVQTGLKSTATLLNCVELVQLRSEKIKITLKPEQLSNLIDVPIKRINSTLLDFEVPFNTKKRGVETKFVIGTEGLDNHDPVLIKNLAKANAYYDAIKQGQTFDQIADKHSTSKRRVQHLVDLAFISPTIASMVIDGEQPSGLTSEFLRYHPLSSNWDEQMKLLLCYKLPSKLEYLNQTVSAEIGRRDFLL